jgi:hypothetical protein
MVSTEEVAIRLGDYVWRHVSVSVACANRTKTIPREGDTFSIRRSPRQKDLANLMPLLDRSDLTFETRQAAVWIVSDDASYSDLGSLVQTLGISVGGREYPSVGSGERIIRAEDTAKAMNICEEAGIDITRKKIWKDRRAVLGGVSEGDVRRWLVARIVEYEQ